MRGVDRKCWLDPKLFGTHSLRRTKATLIYRRTGNFRAVQLLLGHTEVDDALAIAEKSMSEVPRAERTCSARSDSVGLGQDRQLYSAISMIYAFAVLFRLARQTVLPGSRSINRPPPILAWYGRKQGNGGTRSAGVIHAATESRPHPTGRLFFAAPRFRARTGQPSADVQADKIPSRITGC